MDIVNIRSVQHYLYCPHRWGLIEIGQIWAENYFVVKANLLHSRVHEVNQYTNRGKKVYASVYVWNDEYGIFGVTDCIEEYNGEYCIVEYKPRKPSKIDFNDEDAIQVYAQKLCVDDTFKTDCKAQLYYADVKKRIMLPFAKEKEKYDSLLKGILSEIRYNTENGIIPPIQPNQNCSGCSMKDLCMPKRKYFDVRKQIKKNTEEGG